MADWTFRWSEDSRKFVSVNGKTMVSVFRRYYKQRKIIFFKDTAFEILWASWPRELVKEENWLESPPPIR